MAMPEMQEFFSFIDKLRLGAAQRTPRQLAGMLADIQRTEYDTSKVVYLEQVMAQVIFDLYGPDGLLEFTQEYLKRIRR